MFAQHGYGAVSMRRLAKELGVSTGTLYHYFPGKEELFRHLVDHRSRMDIDEATRDFDQAEGADQKLVFLAAFISQQHDRLGSTLRIALDYARHEEDAELLARVLDGYRSPLADALGPEGGELALSLVLGMLVQRLLQAEPDLGAHLAALGRLR